MKKDRLILAGISAPVAVISPPVYDFPQQIVQISATQALHGLYPTESGY